MRFFFNVNNDFCLVWLFSEFMHLLNGIKNKCACNLSPFLNNFFFLKMHLLQMNHQTHKKTHHITLCFEVLFSVRILVSINRAMVLLNIKKSFDSILKNIDPLQCHSLYKLCSLNSGSSWMNERYFHDMDGELYTNLTWEKGFSAHSIARISKTIEHSCDFRSLSLNSNHWLLSASESCDTRLQN